ncbi:MAG: pyridoxamine 5'-phosphate oxidase family protein, partial [Dehalococcoidia bacterium]|nr:pyridoxamine 5'-phosphate oxidase family protein [Dehalococcoidia bacterium]
MSEPTLVEIRAAFEGLAPATVATSSADGVPNVVFVSQLHYLDEERVGISNQFLSKTKKNLTENPYAMALVLHPETARSYRLWLRLERSETEGGW